MAIFHSAVTYEKIYLSLIPQHHIKKQNIFIHLFYFIRLILNLSIENLVCVKIVTEALRHLINVFMKQFVELPQVALEKIFFSKIHIT